LQRAKTLLETTDLPVERVARLVGMNATTHLNHFFRRWLQMTPGEYRRQQRGR
jgi:transcriptional regulator GlxA family with amidase domain